MHGRTKILDHFDKAGRWHTTYLLTELGEALVHDGLDDAPVDISEPDTHESSNDE